MDPAIEDTVRRVVSRIVRERAAPPPAAASPPAVMPPVAAVVLGSGPRALVDAAQVGALPRGSTLEIASAALVTPLARDVARERSITLRVVSGAAVATTVALGADHGGFRLKDRLARWLESQHYRVLDLGTASEEACDYPDFALAVARAVASGNCGIGVMVDGAGIGSAMVGNRVAGVLAAHCATVAAAQNAREHNFANMLTLGARQLSEAQALEILAAFLATPEGEARHRRRVEKIRRLDRSKGSAS